MKKLLPGLTRSAGDRAKAKNIEAARTSFGSLSGTLIAYRNMARGNKPIVAYCGMAKKSWLQGDKTITNPDYGASHL